MILFLNAIFGNESDGSISAQGTDGVGGDEDYFSDEGITNPWELHSAPEGSNVSFTAFIFARGGSKGLPGKHLKPIAGKSLLSLSIEHAFSVDVISRVADCIYR